MAHVILLFAPFPPSLNPETVVISGCYEMSEFYCRCCCCTHLENPLLLLMAIGSSTRKGFPVPKLSPVSVALFQTRSLFHIVHFSPVASGLQLMITSE